MDIGDIYESNNDGEMIVVEYNGALSVKVRFTLTGYTTITRASHIRNGCVRDSSLLPKAGDMFESNNCGKFTVLEYNGARDVVVRFIETGTVVRSESGKVRSGAIHDYFVPSVLGVGFFGDGNYKANINGKDTKCYKVWHGMMTRCYCHKTQEKQPTYKGCSVSSEWHNFQMFAKWYHDNHPNDGGKYQLDKDIKIDGNKVYSPETCLIVTAAENNIKAHAKRHRMISPLGGVVEIYNMAKFCRDNGLSEVLMGRVNNGKQGSHKGWVKA